MSGYSRNRISKREREMLIFASVVFVITFAVCFVYNFISNCIFEWPIRWDIGTCWNEQIQPSKQKASEAVINFIP